MYEFGLLFALGSFVLGSMDFHLKLVCRTSTVSRHRPGLVSEAVHEVLAWVGSSDAQEVFWSSLVSIIRSLYSFSYEWCK